MKSIQHILTYFFYSNNDRNCFSKLLTNDKINKHFSDDQRTVLEYIAKNHNTELLWTKKSMDDSQNVDKIIKIHFMSTNLLAIIIIL